MQRPLVPRTPPPAADPQTLDDPRSLETLEMQANAVWMQPQPGGDLVGSCWASEAFEQLDDRGPRRLDGRTFGAVCVLIGHALNFSQSDWKNKMRLAIHLLAGAVSGGSRKEAGTMPYAITEPCTGAQEHSRVHVRGAGAGRAASW